MKHINSLDGSRAIGLLMIMLFHVGYVTPGYIALQFCFVLSGFLITNILLRYKEKSSFRGYLKRFFWRRTLRIFPIYYLYILATGIFFLVFALPEDYPYAFPHLMSYTFNYFYLMSEMRLDYFGADFDYFFTHCWSLSVEEQFYVIWPFVTVLTPLKRLKVVLIAIVLMAPVFRFFMADFLFQNTDYSAIAVGELILRLLPAPIARLSLVSYFVVF